MGIAERAALPTAQEMEDLIEQVRNSPGAAAFVKLAKCYLALGRPKDAVAVANVGLAAAPDNVDGRMAQIRGYVALHQWKEAQGELLRVVKNDRAHGEAFALLGEVLLRRADYERAIPVLQHAQNLAPGNTHLLTLLRKARMQEGLEPPPPIPTAVPPRDVDVGAANKPSAAIPSPKLSQAFAPQLSQEGVRPRLLGAKPKHAALAALKQSAAVGESYVTELLRAGMLQVGGVQAMERVYDLRPARRWSRAARRMFAVGGFVLLLLVVSSVGGYVWQLRQAREGVMRAEREAELAMAEGRYQAYATGLPKLATAAARNPLLRAAYAKHIALRNLLYGGDASEIKAAIANAGTPTHAQATRSLALAQAALQLSQPDLPTAAELARELERLAHDIPTDTAPHDAQLAAWLGARAQRLAGQAAPSRATLQRLAGGAHPLVLAQIELGDAMLDAGETQAALATYEAVLKDHEGYPLALLGRALARSEAGQDLMQVIDDVSVGLDGEQGPLVAAYRELVHAAAQQGLEEYATAAQLTRKARELGTRAGLQRVPRFVVRLARLAYAQGHFDMVKELVAGVTPASPGLAPVRAGLALADGEPTQALQLLGRDDDDFARRLRAYAHIDKGAFAEAFGEASQLGAAQGRDAPSSETQVLVEATRALSASTGGDRQAALDALEKIARRAKTKLGRHWYGELLLRMGLAHEQPAWVEQAQRQLMLAVADISDELPNPLLFRSHVMLAETLLALGNAEEAASQIAKGAALNPSYKYAAVVGARAASRKGDGSRAVDLLTPLVDHEDYGTPEVMLARAEALIVRNNESEQDHRKATELLLALRGRYRPERELGRVAALLDPGLAVELGLSRPEHAARPATSSKPSGSSRRRRRR